VNRVSVSCAPQDPAPPGLSSNRYHVATVLTRYRQYPCASYHCFILMLHTILVQYM
jgi:hypothetical protein